MSGQHTQGRPDPLESVNGERVREQIEQAQAAGLIPDHTRGRLKVDGCELELADPGPFDDGPLRLTPGNLRRLAACWNYFDDSISTEAIQADSYKTLRASFFRKCEELDSARAIEANYEAARGLLITLQLDFDKQGLELSAANAERDAGRQLWDSACLRLNAVLQLHDEKKRANKSTFHGDPDLSIDLGDLADRIRAFLKGGT